MKTLVMGQTSSLLKEFYQQLKRHSRFVIASEKDENITAEEYTKIIHPKLWQENLAAVFSAHSFDAILYFLPHPEETEGEREEVENLVHLLNACISHPVKKIIMVSTVHLSVEETQKKHTLSLCENLCHLYKEQYDLPLTILRAPFLFSSAPGDDDLTRKLEDLIRKNETVLDGLPGQTMDFLSQYDLGVLVSRILLDSEKNISILDVPGSTRLTVQELANVLQSRYPEAMIRFSGKKLLIPPPVNSQTAFQEYQWVPEVDIREGLDHLTGELRKNISRERISWSTHFKNFYGKSPLFFILLELAVGYILMRYLDTWATQFVPFRTIDFRLLFVVLFAAVHGHHAGIAAAFLAELALFMDYRVLEVDWRIIFYNVNNWVPFAVYLIVGAILGYIRDQNRMKQAILSEENATIAERYLFLNDIYEELLGHKTGMEKQIISSRENFGRLFYTLNKLEKINTANFFLEAVPAVEELLDNHTISFYQMAENTGAAHLIAASSHIQNKIPQKLTIQTNQKIEKTLRKGAVWVNKAQEKDYPAFIYPITFQNQTKILLTIHEVPFEQMNVDQENLVKVAGSLVHTYLQRTQHTLQKNANRPPLSQIVEWETSSAAHSAEKKKIGQRQL